MWAAEVTHNAHTQAPVAVAQSNQPMSAPTSDSICWLTHLMTGFIENPTQWWICKSQPDSQSKDMPNSRTQISFFHEHYLNQSTNAHFLELEGLVLMLSNVVYTS